MKRVLAITTALALCFGMTACVDAPDDSQVTEPDTTVRIETPLPVDPGEMFSQRDYETDHAGCVTVTLSDSGSVADGAGVSIDGSVITVTQEGIYCFTGTLSNGQIRVAAKEKDKVQLVLKDASVTRRNSAALYILSGDKVFVTLAEGSDNCLTANGEFVQTDENQVDAAVFAKADLCFNGEGKLTVVSEKGHGIVTKDDLKFTGGVYHVTAAAQGVTGKDSIRVAGGDLTVNSGTDGLHSKHDSDAEKGYIYIIGGNFHITAGADGMDASSQIVIQAGDFTVKTGDGSASVTHSGGSWGGGAWGQGSSSTSTKDSCKGIKAGSGITISGGVFNLDNEDDSIHCGGNVVISGGEMVLATGDDGIHADQDLGISGGKLTVTKSYEGLEGINIAISGGQIDLTASDDGINAAGGNDGSGMAGPWGPGGFDVASGGSVVITGGTLLVNAGGDGLDSNGDLTVSGGVIYVDGPENGGNGALDYNGTGKITGGVLVALGAAGMAENFGNTSTQGSILVGINGTVPAGTEVCLKDSKGNVIVSYTARKTFSSVVVSAPQVEKGGSYTVCVGDASMELTMSSIIYGSGGGMGGGRPGGGGKPGGRP